MSTGQPQSLRVAVLMGGPSKEAEVSRSSARGVAAALEAAGHRAELIELDPQVASQLARLAPDVVFPALHGPPGEDGTVQGLLSLLELPFVGAGVRGSAVAMDKRVAKLIFADAGLPVLPDVAFDPSTDLAQVRTQILRELGEAVVLKPLAEGSAIGVMRLQSAEALDEALPTAVAWPGGGIAEPYVEGAEVTVGILDLAGQPAIASPPIQIETAKGEWYDFHNRYAVGKSEHILPAPLPVATLEALKAIALSAHRALDLKDLSRSDFLIQQDGEPVLLETNTLPGMTPTSLYPDGAKAIGLDFSALTDALVKSAWRRARSVPSS